ncbi:Asp-tRNA(Asn)/Glu-tRNA(Gln) amidotransferase subunit GatA [Thermanaerosceptrum fracticalcis]|uniref:Glutamyl-tRNA(Gln) amidotransferase subunit A n=1 Tax=Thermanaerosceptrum fracticalcis TaxID=1712410 RepID=A0A7G6E6J4_THEFR|nr:Asp-tRNA(Asn)/Glu-tRNA(Gln) amidotransferase subunit GatA [Thermanaerosceptrum fracticalcis]QNB47698.1 Asp-tRNA(Asn)/Glu-tRNA(Gln) amidotransferase subunit GatA [Thermanaerosceptrum fracticalcis]
MDLYKKTAHELSSLLQKREVSSEELTRSVLDRINKVEEKVKAFVTVTGEQALEQAREIDEKRARGEAMSPLAGIPMAMKDNICTKGVTTTCASKILYNFVPPYNATVTEKLLEAGTILLGKCNMDEFAMGSSNENSGFFPTRNPHDLSAVPGGSSGGAAAAVAADEAVFTLGSDTGGSIRQPAAFCGVVGLKPTYGYVPRYGLIAYASSLDQIGPLTKDITDCALVLNVIAGHDPKDSTSAPVEVPDFTRYLVDDVKGLKIGIPKEYMGEGIDPRIAAYLKQAAAKLEELGAVCEEVSLPHTEYALPAYYIIASAEASSNLARYDGVRYGLRVEAEDVISMFCKTRSQGFGEEVKRRIMLGTYALSSGYYDAYYLKALKVRTLIKRDFDQAFLKYDCLLTPTSPTTAFKFGEKVNDPLAMYLSDVCTIPINLAGVPGLSLPFGTVEGLPVGIQFIGKPFGEGTLLRVGYALEQNTDLTKPKAQMEGVI